MCQMDKETNDKAQKAVNDLARAAFVRHQMDDERVTMREALRALGRRMRRFSAM